MNILILGPIHRQKEFLQQQGKYPFLRSQGQQSWVNALEELGHNVTVFRYTDSVFLPMSVQVSVSDLFYSTAPKWYARWRRLNDRLSRYSPETRIRDSRLLTIVAKRPPELLIISGGVSGISEHVIDQIRQISNCPVLLFSGINPTVGASTLEKSLVQNKLVDCVVENDKGYANLWENIGAKKTLVLPMSSVDPDLHKRITLTQQEFADFHSDVCFIGSLTRDRQEKLKSIRNVNLKIWGDIPGELGLDAALKPYYKGEAFGEKMVKIFNAAKIVLNFQPADMTHGGNMRTFEIPGCSAFQLADRVDNEWFTDKKEVILFSGQKDMEKKIQYYLSHEKEREAIALGGYKRARKEHTYKHHFQTLLFVIFPH